MAARSRTLARHLRGPGTTPPEHEDSSRWPTVLSVLLDYLMHDLNHLRLSPRDRTGAAVFSRHTFVWLTHRQRSPV